ncbi:MAG: Holliday junction resolvase RuvX [Paludibacteraceae bacterium]|nr:Holliday junction resolvase RuvX [Paludibacteraceae bacterium]
MSRILAIDYGRKRTGLAVTDPAQMIASPLETIATAELPSWLDEYFRKEQVETVVIGMPRRMNNQPSESYTYIEPFIRMFRKRFPQVDLQTFDERFTSVLAHRAMIEGGMKRKQRQDKTVVDKIAACIILEDYLNNRLVNI